MPPRQGELDHRRGANRKRFPERPRRSEASEPRIQTTLEGEREDREEREPRGAEEGTGKPEGSSGDGSTGTVEPSRLRRCRSQRVKGRGRGGSGRETGREAGGAGRPDWASSESRASEEEANRTGRETRGTDEGAGSSTASGSTEGDAEEGVSGKTSRSHRGARERLSSGRTRLPRPISKRHGRGETPRRGYRERAQAHVQGDHCYSANGSGWPLDGGVGREESSSGDTEEDPEG